MKKILNLFLVFALQLAFSTGIFAQFGGGTGISSDPYQINSLANLELLVSNVNSGTDYAGEFFVLTDFTFI